MTTRSTAASLFVSLRPDQWTKNLIVFAALIFAVKLLDPAALAKASAAFLIFCALSGRRLSDQRRLGSRAGSAASAQAAAADRIGRACRRAPPSLAAVGLSAIALAAAFALRPAVRGGGGGVPGVVRRLHPLAEAHRGPRCDGDRDWLRAAGGGGRIGDQRARQQLVAGLHDARGVVPGPGEAAA